jgi:outer membrane protein OmpA-like peptidoglycan-associated protein
VILEANLQEMADFPDVRVDLVGHTNSVGSDSANLVLSGERADTVYHWLVNNGISSTRLTMRAVGESDPVADNTTEEGRALNDRVEFVIW